MKEPPPRTETPRKDKITVPIVVSPVVQPPATKMPDDIKVEPIVTLPVQAITVPIIVSPVVQPPPTKIPDDIKVEPSVTLPVQAQIPALAPVRTQGVFIPAMPQASGDSLASFGGTLDAPPGPPSASRGPGSGGGAGTGRGAGIGSGTGSGLGPGSGGGTGTGRGTGIGPGTGSGLGPGSGGGTGGGTYRPGNGVTLPRLLSEVRPQYTSDAMRAKVQGTVLLECVVKTDGTVGDVRVIRSLDPTFGLDQEAVRAAKQWRFAPGMRQDEPVAVLISIELTFTLR
jgi:TonB family protein